ncbi:MAG: MFS transporter [Bacteroidia bacterium]
METEQTHSRAYLYLLFTVCFAGGVFGGITSTLMSSYLPDVVRELTGNNDQQKMEEVSAVINSVYLFGMTFGGLLLGYFCDRAGRKNGVILSIACIGLFTLLTSFAGSWLLVVALRFFTGFGVGGVLVATTILIAEEWTEQKRNIMLGILSITIPVGIFSAGLITYNFPDWRKGFLTGVLPLLLAVIGQFSIKESNKWQEQRALKSDSKTLSSSVFPSLNMVDLLHGSIIYGAMLIGLWAVFAWLPTWVQTVVQNSSGQKERSISMMLFAIGGLTGGFLSGVVGNFLGVKKTMLLCFGLSFVLSVVLFGFTTSLSIMSYLEMALIALFFGISQGALNVYIPSLFPTHLRSSATGFCFNIGRIFTASVVFFVGWLVSVLGGYGHALTLFSFIFLLGFMITLTTKEKQFIR